MREVHSAVGGFHDQQQQFHMRPFLQLHTGQCAKKASRKKGENSTHSTYMSILHNRLPLSDLYVHAGTQNGLM
ncbi:hypothetical protein Q5P01_008984 [Channa striata]|uniref:Uncharacterized protein n=1 Tax=Channa striata TaxID=64152 RepID=A0AA88N309_CHASR|nr:hypothetical protein Q5P01_008984 [Channa striata]